MDDYFEIIRKKAYACDRITKEIEKQIKNKKISKKTNSKLITLYFLRNINRKKKETKALTLFFSNQYNKALLLSFIGANYGE